MIGRHDFRNFCKMDVQNTTNFVRTLHSCDILPFPAVTTPAGQLALFAGGVQSPSEDPSACDLLEFRIHGDAFLYHQIRCTVAVLCLVGAGLEAPAVVDQLLDVAGHLAAKPSYELAPPEPLVLFHCDFGPLLRFRVNQVTGQRTIAAQMAAAEAARVQSGVLSLLAQAALAAPAAAPSSSTFPLLGRLAATAAYRDDARLFFHTRGPKSIRTGVKPPRYVPLAQRPREATLQERLQKLKERE
jgi:hypothetical protein